MVMSRCARRRGEGTPSTSVVRDAVGGAGGVDAGGLGEEEGVGGLGAAFADRRVAVGDEAVVVGEGVDAGQAGIRLLGQQPDREQRMPVLSRQDERVTGLADLGAAAGGAVGVDRQHRPTRGGAGMGQGAAGRDPDHPVLQQPARAGELGTLRHVHRTQRFGVGADGRDPAGQPLRRVGDDPGVGRGDRPARQRLQRRRHGSGEQP